jgi:hypothetical protein
MIDYEQNRMIMKTGRFHFFTPIMKQFDERMGSILLVVVTRGVDSSSRMMRTWEPHFDRSHAFGSGGGQNRWPLSTRPTGLVHLPGKVRKGGQLQPITIGAFAAASARVGAHAFASEWDFYAHSYG